MANRTISITFKLDGDTKSFQILASDAKKLRAAMESAMTPAEQLSRHLLDFNQASQIFSTFANVVTGLSSAFGQLAGEYNQVQVNEDRLAQAMRNTMDASDDEIRNIIALADAQERIGVVSADAQLAAAQELATYLEYSTSLERLIPVLNDMAAQQLGVGASMESVTSIATMLGKVMNGQTEALSRYGYKFDEAQKQVLKFGTESERAAVLAEVVEQSVRGMNEQLGQTAAGRLEQARARMGEFREELGRLVTGIQPVVEMAAQFSLAAVGAMQLTNSLKAMRAAIAGVNVKDFAKQLTRLPAIFRKARIEGQLLSLVMKKIAWPVVIVGALATAVGVLVGRVNSARRANQEFAESYRQAQEPVAAARAEIMASAAAARDFKGTQEEQAALVDQLNTRWGTVFGNYQTLSEWYGVLSKNAETYAQKLSAQAEMEVIAARMGEQAVRRRQLSQQLTGMSPTQQRTFTGTAGSSTTVTVENKEYTRAKEELEALDDAMATDQQTLKGLITTIAALDDQLKQTTQTTDNTIPTTEDLAKDIAELRIRMERAVEVNRTFASGMSDDSVEIKELQSGIVSLIQKYGLENSAIRDLIDEYHNLVEAKRASRAEDALPGLTSLRGIGNGAVTAAGGLAVSVPGEEETRTWRDFYREAQEGAADTVTAFGAVTGAMRDLSGVVGEGAAQWLNWGSTLLQTIGQAIPAIASLVAMRKAEANANMEAAASGAAASVAGIPVTGAVMAVAAVASVIAALASIPKFAKGGIAYGPTLGVFGEYSGARNNPEVVAPLDRLRGMLQPAGAGMGGQVEFEIRGDRLVGVLNRYNSKIRRS